MEKLLAAVREQLGRELTQQEAAYVERAAGRPGAENVAVTAEVVAREIEEGQVTDGDAYPWEEPESGFMDDPAQVAVIEDVEEALTVLETDPNNEEAQQVLDDARESDEQTLIRYLEERARREQQFNYDWVYGGEMQLDMGSLDTTEALLSLKDTLEEMGLAEFDEDLEEDELEFQIKSLLQRSSQNVEIRAGVRQWARETQNYLTPKETSYYNLINQGLNPAKAKTFLSVSSQFDIDPEQLYRIWENRGVSQFGLEETLRQERENVAGQTSLPQFRKKSPFQIARDFKEGLDMYDGSSVLAGLHASDPELAAKMREDPYGLDSGELRRALTLLGHGEGSGQEGTASGDPQLDWIKTRLAGGFQKPSANVDSGAVTEAVKTLAQAWNLEGVEGVTQQAVQDVVAGAVARARANLPNPFAPLDDVTGVDVRDTVMNAEARIRQRLRQAPEYQELFGHKQGAESEEEYVSRFERRSQAILGDDVSSVVRNAMRSGNVNTVYQQALNTEAGDSSTRFQEILARNAEVFRKML